MSEKYSAITDSYILKLMANCSIFFFVFFLKSSVKEYI